MIESVDPRVVDCQRKIRNNNSRIDECRRKITELQSDVEELKNLRLKYINLQNDLDNSVSKSENQINSIVGAVFNALSVIKSTFFSPMMEVIKGPQLTRAKNGLETSIQKIDAQIYKSQNEIETLQREISSLLAKNATLSAKIVEYRRNPIVTM